MANKLSENYDPYERLKLLHQSGYIREQDKLAKAQAAAAMKRRKAALAQWRKRRRK